MTHMNEDLDFFKPQTLSSQFRFLLTLLALLLAVILSLRSVLEPP